MALTEELALARRAFEDGAWKAGCQRWARADTLGPVPTADLFRWATAASLLGREEDALESLRRGYVAAEAGPDPAMTVRFAAWLALLNTLTGRPAVASGWLERGASYLGTVPEDCPEAGLLRIPRGMLHLFSGRAGEARAVFDEVLRIGAAHHDDDLTGFAQHAVGRTELALGRIAEGLPRLDQAMTIVLTGRMNPVLAGVVYCSLLEGCHEVGDLGRARQWTVALTRWCGQQPDLVAYTGQCSVHRAQIMILDGEFLAALDELDLARRRYALLAEPNAIGEAWYEEAEVARLLGDRDRARRCYAKAADLGRDPLPGLALLYLDQGAVDQARAALSRALVETDGPHRALLLPAATEVALAADQHRAAREAAEELAHLAERCRVPTLLARASIATGQVALASGRAVDALRGFRVALRTWHEVQAPYEIAAARVWTGLACRALGDDDAARVEMEAARASFAAMGADPAVARCHAVLGKGRPRPDGLSAREVEVLRLVAAGATNAEIARELFLSQKTIARHLSNIFTKLDVHTRTAAAGYAHQNHLLTPPPT